MLQCSSGRRYVRFGNCSSPRIVRHCEYNEFIRRVFHSSKCTCDFYASYSAFCSNQQCFSASCSSGCFFILYVQVRSIFCHLFTSRNPHLEYCPFHDIQDEEKKCILFWFILMFSFVPSSFTEYASTTWS